MSDAPRLDRDLVAEKVTARDLLGAYGVSFRKGGGRNELEAKTCPARSDHGTLVFRFNEQNKRWQCMSCGTKGDAFGFVAAMEGLDVRNDFPRVLARTAEIAGVTPDLSPPEERQRRAEALRVVRLERERAEIEEAERDGERAVAKASAYWRALSLRDPAGESYLARRGVPNVIRMNGRVRFDRRDATGRDRWSSDGAPSLALYDLGGRGISGVVRRRLPEVITADPGERGVKAPSLTGCAGGGTMAHDLSEITAGRDVVVTEGIADTITALAVWPRAVVLGANGTGPLPTVVEHAARRVRAQRGRLLLVPHADENRQGERAAGPGLRAGLAAGLRRGLDLVLVDLEGHKDLNDAWLAGWRPT